MPGLPATRPESLIPPLQRTPAWQQPLLESVQPLIRVGYFESVLGITDSGAFLRPSTRGEARYLLLNERDIRALKESFGGELGSSLSLVAAADIRVGVLCAVLQHHFRSLVGQRLRPAISLFSSR